MGVLSKRFVHAAMVLAVALLASGCLQLDVQLTVSEDGDHRLDVSYAENPMLTAQAFKLAEVPTTDDDRQAWCSRTAERLTTGAREDRAIAAADDVSVIDDGEFCGVEMILWVDSEELEAGGELFELPMTLSQDETTGNWVFEIEVSNTQSLMQELADSPEAVDYTDVRIAVEFPTAGDVGEHNADEVNGDRTFVWEPDFDDPPERLFATLAPRTTSESSRFLLYAFGVVLLIGLVVAGLLATRLNRDDPPTIAE